MEKFYTWYITMDGMLGKQEMYFLTIEISFIGSEKINLMLWRTKADGIYVFTKHSL